MPRKVSPFIARMQAEGTTQEKLLEKEELHKKALELSNKIPSVHTDRLMYIRNLLLKTMRGEIDKDVFKEFVKMTNTYVEVREMTPRAQMLINKERRH